MCFGIMISRKKLLNLLGILAIGSFSLQEAVAVDDLDDTLRQAIFLVKLLKSDFAQVLRANEIEGNFTEEEDKNSTCSLPPEDFNSTVAINGTEVTASAALPKDVVSTTPSTPASPAPSQPHLRPNMLPAVPMMMPYASWPPMPMGYPPAPSAPGQRSFSDLNYRLPYRLSRRRMVPDYYYYDGPFRSHGNFRRFNNELTGEHLGDTTATSQAQTSSSPTPVTSEATTFHVDETATSTSSLPTTQPSTLIPPATEKRILRMDSFVNQSLLATSTADSTNQSYLSSAKSTKRSFLPKTKKPKLPSTLKTKTRKKIHHKKRASKPKPTARTKVIAKHKKKNIKVSQLRQASDTPGIPTTSDTPDTPITSDTAITSDTSITTDTSDTSAMTAKAVMAYDANATTNQTITPAHVEMDEIAKELRKEIEGNEEDTELNITETTQKYTTKKKKTTTMKIFLPHSSRIPIPFPENNAFCHFHPESTLCGTNL